MGAEIFLFYKAGGEAGMFPCLTDQRRKIRKDRPFVQDLRSAHYYSDSFFDYVYLLLDLV